MGILLTTRTADPDLELRRGAELRGVRGGGGSCFACSVGLPPSVISFILNPNKEWLEGVLYETT